MNMIKIMNKYIIYFLMLFANIENSYCQLTPCKEKVEGFNLRMDNLFYSHVINCGLDSSTLLENAKANLMANRMFSQVVQTGSRINCIVNGHEINYAKFGGKKISLWLGITVPVSYNFSVDIKKNKYKITLTNIKSVQPEIYLLGRLVSPQVKFNFNTDIFNNNGCLKSQQDFYIKSLEMFSNCVDDFYTLICENTDDQDF